MRSLVPLTLVATISTVAAACGAPAETQQPQEAGRTVVPKQYSVADFYKNTEFFGASWSPDRQRILVSSNLSGIWNAYAVPVAGGDPVALTKSTTNSVYAISYFPADERILLSSESDEIVAAAKKNGVPVEYIVFSDEGHGFQKKENEIKGYTAIIEFLDAHLKGPPARVARPAEYNPPRG